MCYTRLSFPFRGMISATYRLYLPFFKTGFLEDQRKLVSLLSREEKKVSNTKARGSMPSAALELQGATFPKHI